MSLLCKGLSGTLTFHRLAEEACSLSRPGPYNFLGLMDVHVEVLHSHISCTEMVLYRTTQAI